MVNVLRFFVLQISRIFSCLADGLQSLQNLRELRLREHTDLSERASMRGTALHLFHQQPLIEWQRALPCFELRVQRLPKSAGPHLHAITSRSRQPAGDSVSSAALANATAVR